MFIEIINGSIKKTFSNRLFVFITIFFVAQSCNIKKTKNDDANFEKVIQKIEVSTDQFDASDLRIIDSAYSTLKNPGLKSTAEWQLRKIMYFTIINDKLDSVKLYADSNIKLLQNHLDDARFLFIYIKTLYLEGEMYFNNRNYNEAIKYYTKCKMAFSSASKPDSINLYLYYTSMAKALYAQKKYLLAADFFRAKFLLAPTVLPVGASTHLSVQENISNAGMCFFNAGMPDSAMFYYAMAMAYINKSETENIPNISPAGFEEERSVIYRNQADILYQQKNYYEAEKLYEISIDKAKTLDSNFMRPLKLSLANLYLDIGQQQKALSIINDLLAEIDVTEVSNNVVNINRLLSSYYIKIGMSEKANDFFIKALSMRDSVERRDHSFNTTDIRDEVENEEQKVRNESLKKDIRIEAGYLLTIIISLGLAIITIMMIWRSFIQKTKYGKQLVLLNNGIDEKNKGLQKTLAELEQSHTENSRIMHMMAHDLKKPIKHIRTLTDNLLKMSISKNQSQYKQEALDLIKTTCDDSVTLIDDLINKKRRLAEVRKELVNMGRLIEQCSELFREKAIEKKQQLLLDIDYPLIKVDRQRIWRVISNIVNNAIKFSPEEGEILIKLERKNDGVVLSVRDHGIGIPTRLKEKIFTHDPEISRAGTAGEESYGLGLVISRKIVEEHDGRLWFESKTGEGSIFFVELPYE